MEFAPLLPVLVFLLLHGPTLAQQSIFNADPINTLLKAAAGMPDLDISFAGLWELRKNSGVSAMHMVVTKENKAVMFDGTNFRPSQLKLPAGNCRPDPTGKTNVQDCWAHAVEYDFVHDQLRPLKVLTNTWCSSGGFDANGTLVQSGGFLDGGRGVRYLQPCATCDWIEYPTALSANRWYATQQILPDGSFIVVGGRRAFSYEFIPARGQSNPSAYSFRFLVQTTDPDLENNLYPFLHLSTDGNVFIFANNRSVLLDPKTQTIVREFPALGVGSHNYPASASSALLPLRLRGSAKATPAEVLICGGASHVAAALAVEKIFKPALRTCSRLTITSPNARWHTELMPTPRVMGDMLLLPNSDVLIINGATNGTSGWDWAEVPNLEPILYHPNKKRGGDRFKRLAPSTIPRMYHSTSAVLPDTSILVAGSNPNSRYNYTAKYPTEVRVERFYPPYFDSSLAAHRPTIDKQMAPSAVGYGENFEIQFVAQEARLDMADVKVTMYAPPFTTHGYSMGQRLLVLRVAELSVVGPTRWKMMTSAPPSGAVAPPGYYMLFVVNRGVPSEAVWVQVH